MLDKIKTEFFENVSLELKTHKKIGLLGHNGVGKTTLLRSILGLHASSGDIKILGHELKELTDWKSIYPSIGYLFQDSDDSFIASSVIDEVAFNAYNKSNDYEVSRQKAIKMLKNFGIEDLAYKIPLKLSGGQKRIVAFCAALIHEPQILLLDEPSNHLDENMRDKMEQALRDFEGTVIMVAHDKEFAKKIVDKFYRLEKDGLKEIDSEEI